MLLLFSKVFGGMVVGWGVGGGWGEGVGGGCGGGGSHTTMYALFFAHLSNMSMEKNDFVEA